VKLNVHDVNVRVFVFTHACAEDRAPERRKLPAEVASHREMLEMLSDAPVFVHTGAVPVIAR
jgi:hypothetical protein